MRDRIEARGWLWGQRRDHDEQGEDDSDGDRSGGAERQTPAEQVTEQGAGWYPGEGAEGHAREDHGVRTRTFRPGAQARPQRRGDGPETSESDAEEDPAHQEHREASRDGDDQVRDDQEAEQDPKDVAAIHAAGNSGRHQRGGRGDKARDGDHQPSDSLADADVIRDAGEQRDRQELGGDERERPHRDHEHSLPRGARGAGIGGCLIGGHAEGDPSSRGRRRSRAPDARRGVALSSPAG